jgi:hypothetical protein
MKERDRRNVSYAIHKALLELGIQSDTEFPQLQIRAYHFINVDDFDKKYQLCIPLEASKRLCFETRDHIAYTFALKYLNLANNLARKGKTNDAIRNFVRGLNYFMKRASKRFYEVRVSQYTFKIIKETSKDNIEVELNA